MINFCNLYLHGKIFPNFQQKKLEMPGIEPGAFHMQSERSTTELHPRFAHAAQIGCFKLRRLLSVVFVYTYKKKNETIKFCELISYNFYLIFMKKKIFMMITQLKTVSFYFYLVLYRHKYDGTGF